MRKITEIIIHCSATPAGRNVSVADIERWHRQRGFDSIGYHYVIHLDGKVELGRPVERVGAHCVGHNRHSIGICYIGGVDDRLHPTDTRTPAQRSSLRRLVADLKQRFPHASVYGHNEFAAKDCPCFDVRKEFMR
ncbi:MAG: N-acetylmuramoyl-L-alanine amidase [Muribaculaceae bacterium]|nr:N-acetylmuramoyl-L-alanine amidase [Muribaculaceae bacterium]